MSHVIDLPFSSNALLHAIAGAQDDDVRAELIEDFARKHERAYLAVARQLVSKYRVGEDNVDDVLQIVHIQALDLVRSLADEPDRIDTIHSWVGYVKSYCRNAMQAFVDREDGVAPMSGMTSKYRRLRLASKVRESLVISLGREPTDDEVLSAANERFQGRSRQSNMLLSREDLDWSSVHPAQVDVQRLEVAADDVEEDPPIFVLMEGESREFLSQTVSLLRDAAGEDVAAIAEHWLKPALRKRGGLALSLEQTAEELEVDLEAVQEVVEMTRGAAVRVLRQRVEADPRLREQLEAYAAENGYDQVI